MRYEDLAKNLVDNGGFSVNASGHSPHSGVMVARSGSEQIVPGIASPGDVQSFAEAHRGEVKRAGYYMGGWVEHGKTGDQTVFDVSMRFPTTQQLVDPSKTAGFSVRRRDRVASAQLQGAVHHQRALYDVDRGDDSLPAGQPFPWSDKDMQSFDVKDFPRRPVHRARGEVFGELEHRRRSTAMAGTQLELPLNRKS